MQWLRSVLIEMLKRRRLCRSAEEIRNSPDRSCVFLLQTVTPTSCAPRQSPVSARRLCVYLRRQDSIYFVLTEKSNANVTTQPPITPPGFHPVTAPLEQLRAICSRLHRLLMQFERPLIRFCQLASVSPLLN